MTDDEAIQAMDLLAQNLDQGVAFVADLMRVYQALTQCYSEVVMVGIRLINKVGPDDPDSQALIALMMLQGAEFMENTAVMEKYCDEKGQAA